MKTIKNYILIILICLNNNYLSAYNKYEIKVVRNIIVQGYPQFDYAFWLHPYQQNKELQNLLIKPVLDELKKLIPEGSVVLDIGAHTGDTSVAYSLVTGTKGKVIAFEPNTAAFDVLKINSNLHPNIIPVNLAITEQDGNYTFHYTDVDLCNGGFVNELEQGVGTLGCSVPLEVKGVNLEKWLNDKHKNLIPKIKFIKIDTEGYDKNILKSIKNLIIQCKPIIQCEVFPGLNNEEKKEYFNIIQSLDYKCLLNNKELDINSFAEIKFADIICYPKN